MTDEIVMTNREVTEVRRSMAYRRLAARILGLDPASIRLDLQMRREAGESSSVLGHEYKNASVVLS